uniref:Tudor domain-containing protein n=1 Tax=Cacopsylla melanoneura TaxID=428564 RepID=A0A8D8UXI8_9HEMI
MSTSNHTRGISKVEPQVLLQTSTEDFIRSTPRSAFDYVRTQFLKVDRVELEKFGLTIDDVFLMDRIYMQSSALPHFLTRGAVRKYLVSKMSPDEGNISRFSSSNDIQHEKDHNENHSRRVVEMGKTGLRPQNMNSLNNWGNQGLHVNHQQSFEYNNKTYNNSQMFGNSRGPGYQKNLCTGNTRENGNVNGGMTYKNNKLRHNNQHNGDTHTKIGKAMSHKNDFSSSAEDEGSICSNVSASGGRTRPRNHSDFKHTENNINGSPFLSNSEAKSPQSDGRGKTKKPLTDMIANIRQHSQPASTSIVVQPSSVSNNTSPSANTEKKSDYVVNNSPSASNDECRTVPLVQEEKATVHIEATSVSASVPIVSENESYNLIFGDKIHALAPSHYLVVKECDLAQIEEISNRLKHETLQSWSHESEGKKVVILLNGKYYRGAVVNNTTPDIKGPTCIKLVDVGWYEALDPHCADNIYVLPENLKSMKPIAFTIHTLNLVHIPRNAHATVVETEQSNERVKSVTIQQIQPVSSSLEVQKPAVISTGEKRDTNKNNELDIVSTAQKPLQRTAQEHKNVVIEPTPLLQDNQFENAPVNKCKVELNKRIEVSFIASDETHAEHKWVQYTQSADKLLEWQAVVDKFDSTLTPSSLKLGAFCVKLFDEMWCRAKIVSCNPLTLFYIDFGNVETVENTSEMKPLPEVLSLVQPLAMKVKFYYQNNNNIPMEFGDCFFVTPIETIVDVHIVLKDDETLSKLLMNSNTPVQNLPRYYFNDTPISKTSTLEMNKPVDVAFVQEDTNNATHKWVQEVELYNYIEEWTNISTSDTNQFGRKPDVGEFCVHFYEESWCRGQVIQVEPLTVFYIDYGNKEIISKIEELKPLPKKLSEVKPLAHKIQFFSKASGDLSYNFGDTFKMTPVELKDKVLVVLKDDEVMAKSDVKSLVYQNPVVNLTLNKPMTAAWVQDDEFDNQFTWVQDLTHIDKLEVIDNVMSKSPDKYTEMPKVGDLCAKFYEDMWCRTKVMSTDPFTILYVDFGNTEKIDNLNLLKPLPEHLCEYQGFAFRVLFKNQKPELPFGEIFTMTPLSFDNNVYTVSIE